MTTLSTAERIAQELVRMAQFDRERYQFREQLVEEYEQANREYGRLSSIVHGYECLPNSDEVLLQALDGIRQLRRTLIDRLASRDVFKLSEPLSMQHFGIIHTLARTEVQALEMHAQYNPPQPAVQPTEQAAPARKTRAKAKRTV